MSPRNISLSSSLKYSLIWPAVTTVSHPSGYTPQQPKITAIPRLRIYLSIFINTLCGPFLWQCSPPSNMIILKHGITMLGLWVCGNLQIFSESPSQINAGRTYQLFNVQFLKRIHESRLSSPTERTFLETLGWKATSLQNKSSGWGAKFMPFNYIHVKNRNLKIEKVFRMAHA